MHFTSTNKKFEGSRKKKIPQPLFEFFSTTPTTNNNHNSNNNNINGTIVRDPLMPHPYPFYRNTISSLREQQYNSNFKRFISANSNSSSSICQNALHPSTRDLRHSSNSYSNRTTVDSLINMSPSTFGRGRGSSSSSSSSSSGGGTFNKVDNNYYSLNNYNIDKLNSTSQVSARKGLSSSLSSLLPSSLSSSPSSQSAAAAAAVYHRARSAPPRANNRATNSYQNSYQNQVYRLNLQPDCCATTTTSSNSRSSSGGGIPSPADAEAARRSTRTLLKYQLHLDNHQHQHHSSSSASNPPFALFHS
jgi:hypothetical protein